MRSILSAGIRSQTARYGAASAATICVWFVLGVGAAFAAESKSHPFLLSFCKSGRLSSSTESCPSGGSFADPNGIAIDESTGNVYVADLGAKAIFKFAANGNPASFSALGAAELTGSATPAGSFSFPNLPDTPAAITVDNSTSMLDPSRGDLYVMDAGHGVIDKFNSEGKYLSQIGGFASATGSAERELLGLAVDGNGTLRVELSPKSPGFEIAVDEFDDSALNSLVAEQLNKNVDGVQALLPRGNGERQADGLTVGPSGDDYLLYGGVCQCTGKIGQQLAGLGQVDNEGTGDVAIAADPATGHVYIDGQSSIAEWDPGAINGNDPSKSGQGVGTLVSSFGSSQLSGPAGNGGIAVDGVAGEVFVSNPTDGNVDVFASDAPAASIGSASGIAKEGATLDGSVDPRGAEVTSCVFEYGLTEEHGRASYEHSAPCTPGPAAIGMGNEPVPVSAEIKGLQPGMLYRFRLKVANASATSESANLLATLGTGFEVKKFEVSFVNKDDTPDTQAGSHPYEMINVIEFSTRFRRMESNADSLYARMPDGALKDLTEDLPPGLVGDPNATPKKCTLEQMLEQGEPVGVNFRGEQGGCPVESWLGSLHVEYSNVITQGEYKLNEPAFNVVPTHGVALQIGIHYVDVSVFIDNGVLAGGDYPIQATVTNAPPEAPVFETTLRVRGVVGEGTTRKAFLTLPTGCTGPLKSTLRVDSYEEPSHWTEATSLSRNAAGIPVSLTGCAKLQFPPEISASPDSTDASTSSGLAVHVKVPQTAAFNPNGLAESSLRDTTVTLPEGVTLNPAGADGLEACTSDPGALPEGALGAPGDQIGYKGQDELNAEYEPGVKWNTFTPEIPSPEQPGVNFCPNGSKIGTVKIKTPLLEHELEGAVYLAAQNNNPFGSLVAMYMVAEDPYSGSLIKLAGESSLNPQTGQIVTTFQNTPDLPFEDLELHFFGGERAPLSTPSHCGTYTTKAVFTPWDGNGPVTSESSFNIEHGPNGGPCPGANLPFNPSLTAGTTSIQAGGLSPFTMTMSRDDGNQNLQAISLKMPPGLSGLLTGVELCGEAQANAGTCGPGSQIGETIVSVGVGNDPFTVTGGKVYLTGPYEGAPFGLSIVNPAKAGPYDLGQVIVRAKIEVDPITADLTVTSDNGGPYKIPTMIDGIPLQIKHVNVTINRPGFTFNPTDCDPMGITATLDSTEGAVGTVGVPFQATNCARLAFAPKFAVSTSGRTSKADGASLHVKLTYPTAPFGSQANIHSVKVELPLQLPSRLTTLQKACTERAFDANPASCPAASIIGRAKATTPLLPIPVEGPAYFVSHGGAKFPELIVVLQGYGVTIYLHGETFISKKGITSSTFSQVPDVPVGSFELTLPQGPFSALTASSNLCTLTRTITQRKKITIKVHGHKRTRTRKVRKTVPTTLQMPTSLVAQNGATFKQATRISVTGCAKAKKKATVASRHHHRRSGQARARR